MIYYPQKVRFLNLCVNIPSYTLQITSYQSYVSQHMKIFRDVSSTWHCSTSYNSYKNILPRNISTVVITGIVFSTDTVVPEECSHIHCFIPITLYPLIGYNRRINENMSIPLWSKIPPFVPYFPNLRLKCHLSLHSLSSDGLPTT